MRTTGITPGPWVSWDDSRFGNIGFGPKITPLADNQVGTIYVDVSTDKTVDEAEANARAIAEVPAMIEALYDALPYIEESEQFNKPTRRGLSKSVRAILRRIEGGE